MICPKCQNDAVVVVFNQSNHVTSETIKSVSCTICTYNAQHDIDIVRTKKITSVGIILHDIFERQLFRKFVRSIDENVCRNLSSDVFISNNIRITSLTIGNAISAVVKYRDLLLSKSISHLNK